MLIMDGYEATRFIRADSRFTHLPIIAMTAHTMTQPFRATNTAQSHKTKGHEYM